MKDGGHKTAQTIDQKTLIISKLYCICLPIDFVLFNKSGDGEDLSNLGGVIDDGVHSLSLEEDGVLNFIFSLTLGPFLFVIEK